MEYELMKDGVLDLYHTEVPTSQRGKGVGGRLAEVRGRWEQRSEGQGRLR